MFHTLVERHLFGLERKWRITLKNPSALWDLPDSITVRRGNNAHVSHSIRYNMSTVRMRALPLLGEP